MFLEPMSTQSAPAEELKFILERFSGSIRASIAKFGLDQRGIDPEDVVQEVRIKIWKIFSNGNGGPRFGAYINRIVKTTLIDELRKLRRQEKLIAHEKQKWSSEGSRKSEAAPDESGLKLMITEAADSLIKSRRKVVKLFLSGMTVEEMSFSLGWSCDKTRNLLYRGLADLRDKLREGGNDPEDR